MDYDDERHAAAIGALPALPRALFRLHNFYGVEIGLMADTLATDADDILTCLADARAMIDRQFPIWACKRPTSADMNPRTMDLERRLMLDYRASLEAAIADCGRAGTIPWPEPPTSIEADSEVAARFIIRFLHPPLQRAHTRSSSPDIATVDLWRHAPRWRWRYRDHLLQLANEIRLSGWQAFDIWLADRIAPDLLYPSRLDLPKTLRRPLPEELDPAQQGHDVIYWPDHPAIQRRFDRLPERTLLIYSLNRIYGRSYAEIGRRFAISRKQVFAHMVRAIGACTGSRHSLAEDITYQSKVLWRLLKRKARARWVAFHAQPRAPS